jgi:hypothetical protein
VDWLGAIAHVFARDREALDMVTLQMAKMAQGHPDIGKYPELRDALRAKFGADL